MNTRISRRMVSLMVLAPVLAIGTVTALARAGRTVQYHGNVVSSDVSEIDGRPYMPLADVAHMVGGHVVSAGDGYAIVSGGGDSSRSAAGGANQVNGMNGKVGDWFFDGRWRFQVVSVEHVQEYHYQFAPTGGPEKPNGANDELVVITCHIKNGHADTEQPILGTNGLSSQRTALTDDQGQSYAPTDFDVRGGSLVPGAAKTFAVMFSVPKGVHLQQLIFSLYGFASSDKVGNVRVNLN